MKRVVIALARRLKRTIIGGRTRDAMSTDATERYDYKCAICGTPVATPGGPCSLCRSTDIVSSDPPDDSTGSAPGSTTDADGTITDDLGLRTTVSTTSDAEDRLRRLKATHDDLLVKHATKWHRRNGEKATYGVDLPDGEVKYVRTKNDVRSLLWRFYESDA